MPRNGVALLLDENVPYGVTDWLRGRLPENRIAHALDEGLQGKSDEEVMTKAFELGGAIVVTYDEDLADQRRFPLGSHGGVVRLRVDPTTEVRTRLTLDRLLRERTVSGLARRLVIVDEHRIRVIEPPLDIPPRTPST